MSDVPHTETQTGDQAAPMTSEEARELIPDAIDGTLDDATLARFQAAVAADDALREEYIELRELLSEAAAIGAADAAAAPEVDLLEGVQTKLRRRSRGRYYRDRFSRDVGRGFQMWPLVASCLMLMLLGVAWYALHFAQEIAP